MAETPVVTITSNFLLSATLGSEIRIGAFRGTVISYGLHMDKSGTKYTLLAQETVDHYPPRQDIDF